MNLRRYTPIKRRPPMRRKVGKRRTEQKAITSEARGRPCLIRTPVCTFADDQTVPCHVPDQCDTGMGYIAPPIFVAWGCHACHQLTTTGEYQGVRLERDDRDLYLLRGMRRTQSVLYREGKINV